MRKRSAARMIPTANESDSEAPVSDGTHLLSDAPASPKHAESEEKQVEPNLKGDYLNILLLLVLYTLQGLPIGLSGVIPTLLKRSHGVSFGELAVLSFAAWPYSLKLLWAPIVDATFLPNVGRRKSWIIPVQLLLAALLCCAAPIFDKEFGMGDDEAGPVQMRLITGIMFVFFFLVATQDIAVDGWGLTILRKENVGYASTTNAVGQLLGIGLAQLAGLGLTDAEFCDQHVRPLLGLAPTGVRLATIGDIMIAMAALLAVVTVALWLFKPEPADGEAPEGIAHAYKMLWSVARNPFVLELAVLLQLWPLGLVAIQAGFELELLDKGIKTGQLMGQRVLLIAASLVSSMLVSKFAAGRKPWTVWIWGYLGRLAIGVATILVFSALPNHPGAFDPSTDEGKHGDWVISPNMLWAVFLLALASTVGEAATFSSQMSFYAQVSDPTVGGTYMTVLNTMANFGWSWSRPAVLWAMESVQRNTCNVADAESFSCTDKDGQQACLDSGGECREEVDAYFLVGAATTAIGLLMLLALFRPRFTHLQDLPRRVWRVSQANNE